MIIYADDNVQFSIAFTLDGAIRFEQLLIDFILDNIIGGTLITDLIA